MMMILFLMAACFAQLQAHAQQSSTQNALTVVFSSGFEEGSKSIWDDFDSNPDSTNLLMLHSGPFNTSGNHVMQLRVPPGRGGADLVKVLPGSYDKLYLRWYQMWEPGYDFTARNHGSGLHAGNRNYLGRSNYRPQGNDMFCSYFEPADGRMNLYTYYRGMYMDCVNPNGACWGDHFPCWFDEGEHICTKAEHRERVLPPPMESGKWYCFEMMIDAGTPVQYDSLADGIANFWIDGIEYGPWKHLWFRTTPNLKLNILWMSLFHHAEHSVEGILLDDIVVATERIGCGQMPNEIGENNSMDGESFSIFPNPGEGIYTLKLKQKLSNNLTVTVMNILGQKIFEENFNEVEFPFEHEIHLSQYPKGVYIVFIKVGENKVMRKIIHHLGSKM